MVHNSNAKVKRISINIDESLKDKFREICEGLLITESELGYLFMKYGVGIMNKAFMDSKEDWGRTGRALFFPKIAPKEEDQDPDVAKDFKVLRKFLTELEFHNLQNTYLKNNQTKVKGGLENE